MRTFLCLIMSILMSQLACGQEVSNSLRSLMSSQGKVLYGDEPNSIVVIDYPQNIDSVEEYLSSIDVPPYQVLIEARVVEVKLQKEHSLGVNWTAFQNTTNGPGLDLRRVFGISDFKIAGETAASAITQSIPYKDTFYPPAGTAGGETPFILTIFDKNLSVVLQMLANALDTDILSAPRITTVNNRQAEIKIVERLPWAEPTVTTTETGIAVTWEINFEEVGISLKATPTINDDNRISLVLEPEISEKISDYELTVIQDDREIPYTVPVVSTRKASTKVVVGDKQTLIIGGMIKDRVIKGETKVPLFGDIPFVGKFFKSSKTVKDKTELLIFVSPTIITPEEFKKMAREEQFGTGRIIHDNRKLAERLMRSAEARDEKEQSAFAQRLEALKEEQRALARQRQDLEARIKVEEKKVNDLEAAVTPALSGK